MQPSLALDLKRLYSFIRQFRFLPLMLAASVSVSGCASPNQMDLTSMTLADKLKVMAKKHRVCAVAVAVIKDRKIDSIYSASGCEPALNIKEDSIFQAASLGKPVFAYAVLKLVAQGKLDLDTPILKYLPEGYRHRFNPLKLEPSESVTDPRIRAVTVRMALNHTSGLPNWSRGPLSFDSAPGAEWHYSGEGYVLLQRAVEATTGESLDRLMASQVFEPLAMENSNFGWNERIAQNLLPGTKSNGMPRAKIDFQRPVAAFTLTTTASDYGKFLAAVLSDAQVLDQITTSPVTVDSNLGASWGLGWGLERTRDNLYIWHWGNNPGYRAFVIASVRTGDGFVMFTNSESGLELAEPLTQAILPDDHKIFHLPMLGPDFLNALCNKLSLCF